MSKHCHGIPAQFECGGRGEDVQDMVLSASGDLLALVSPVRISIWSATEQRVCLGSTMRMVSSFSDGHGAVWHEHARCLAVPEASGLGIYSVTKTNQLAVDLKLPEWCSLERGRRCGCTCVCTFVINISAVRLYVAGAPSPSPLARLACRSVQGDDRYRAHPEEPRHWQVLTVCGTHANRDCMFFF